MRLHDRNTLYPYSNKDELEKEISKNRCMYVSFRSEWEHGCYGVFEFANGLEWVITPGWEVSCLHFRFQYCSHQKRAKILIIQWLCADPIVIPSLTAYILSLLRPAANLLSGQHDIPQIITPVRSTNEANPQLKSFFERLLRELINAIAAFFPAKSIFSLRSYTKHIATCIPLTQSSWRDQLIAGNTISWLWDLDRNACHFKDTKDA